MCELVHSTHAKVDITHVNNEATILNLVVLERVHKLGKAPLTRALNKTLLELLVTLLEAERDPVDRVFVRADVLPVDWDEGAGGTGSVSLPLPATWCGGIARWVECNILVARVHADCAPSLLNNIKQFSPVSQSAMLMALCWIECLRLDLVSLRCLDFLPDIFCRGGAPPNLW